MPFLGLQVLGAARFRAMADSILSSFASSQGTMPPFGWRDPDSEVFAALFPPAWVAVSRLLRYSTAGPTEDFCTAFDVEHP